MPDRLSPIEIDELAEAIVKKSSETEFYVDPKLHYNQHERLERLLDAYDAASNVIFKFFIGACLVGLVGFAAMGLGWHK
jgi:hypothetical protein